MTLGGTLGPYRVEDRSPVIGDYYYFDHREGPTEGKMLKGRQKVTLNDAAFYYYFNNKGQAYRRYLVEGRLYDDNSCEIRAEDGDKYRIVDLAEEVD